MPISINRISRSEWNTYKTTAFTYSVTNDANSQGGVHHHQVRLSRSGGWQYPILQSNGRFAASGPVSPIEHRDGEARFATAEVI